MSSKITEKQKVILTAPRKKGAFGELKVGGSVAWDRVGGCSVNWAKKPKKIKKIENNFFFENFRNFRPRARPDPYHGRSSNQCLDLKIDAKNEFLAKN